MNLFALISRSRTFRSINSSPKSLRINSCCPMPRQQNLAIHVEFRCPHGDANIAFCCLSRGAFCFLSRDRLLDVGKNKVLIGIAGVHAEVLPLAIRCKMDSSNVTRLLAKLRLGCQDHSGSRRPKEKDYLRYQPAADHDDHRASIVTGEASGSDRGLQTVWPYLQRRSSRPGPIIGRPSSRR